MPPTSSQTESVDTNGQEPQDTSKFHEDLPACQFCRKKKSRCSRTQPCVECTRSGVECVYDERRMKPGLRTGAMDQLYRRMETLENMFLGQEFLWQQMWKTLYPNEALSASNERSTNIEDLARRRDELKSALLRSSSSLDQREEETESPSRPTKRRRCAPTTAPFIPVSVDDDSEGLLSAEIMTELVSFYFVNIHPWIPILHVTRFWERMQSPDERPRISCILHAIIAVCVRFSQSKELDTGTKASVAEQSRKRVILASTDCYSVEHLQALIIIAFETIERGRGPSSWSIVGSTIGAVNQLQLGVEEDVLYRSTNSGESLIRRMVFLPPSKSWSEAEERRRIFWAVFLMDRFCSVSTGREVSLASDLKRRLPCEGAVWEKETEVCAPFFGIADSKDTAATSSLLNSGAINSDDLPIGGFAYNIEATESLTLVTNFFLDHPFIVADAEKARIWMMKFKELDLRLIQWKLYLPRRWREASVLNSDGVMDPNLTLAHITHNTAVILLHQAIAYPPPHWNNCSIKLPSTSSAETCLEAASEIATIGQQFLSLSPIFTNPQFSFCLFIAGRMLLAHARYNQVIVPPALDTLIAGLLEISQRWTGRTENIGSTGDNLASTFAKRLVDAQNDSSATRRPSLDIRQTACWDGSKEQPPAQLPTGTSPFQPGIHKSGASNGEHHSGDTRRQSPQEPYGLDPFSLAFPPLPPSFQQGFPIFSASDPLSVYAQSDVYQTNPQLNMQSQDPRLGMWQDVNTGFGNDMTLQADLAQVFNPTPNSGQRISRYGVVHVESQEPDDGSRDFPADNVNG
ncbi:Fungal transcriptional regulatory protein, N-terminal [Penicillium camemberti]|uniref:Fungal transcriptional regulatory protein, N-terminal n=1 Tax=Penicillium camemberti (strain FM 013) TaxID=1429867 RepID=A0A0G4PVA1_PENC3|nr:Fungal transcriptional regulatory protein, N-terminal [Penicillium camemberti]